MAEPWTGPYTDHLGDRNGRCGQALVQPRDEVIVCSC